MSRKKPAEIKAPSTARINRNRAKAIAEKCSAAYSYDVYSSWFGVALLLVLRGYTDLEVEAIMRSKWTRWAADMFKGGRSENVPARAVIEWIDDSIARRGADRVKAEVAELVAGTFENFTAEELAQYVALSPEQAHEIFGGRI